MRGDDHQQFGVFSYVSLEERVPFRPIRKSVDETLRGMSKELDGLYAKTGRPSIPPERPLRALRIQVFYSIRSERMLMEQLSYNLLFRWFVGMKMDEPAWNHAVFSKNRERMLNQEVAQVFFARVLVQAKPHMSDEHFTVDGTLIEAWASLKSLQRKDQKTTTPEDPGNPTIDFHGEKRSNDTHESTKDPDALLARKGSGKEAKLSYAGNLLVENRNGFIVCTELFQANGTAERDAGLVMLEQIPGGHRVTVEADKGYDTRDFIKECRHMRETPQVAQNTKRSGGSAINERTTGHAGYAISQKKRKRMRKASDG